MPVKIPGSHLPLLTEPVVVTIGTLMPDGQPHLSAMWCEYADGNILFSTVIGRQKEINVKADNRVTMIAINPENPYSYLEVRGHVEMTLDSGNALINRLAKQYRGKDQYYGGIVPAERVEVEKRVVLTLTPEHVVAH